MRWVVPVLLSATTLAACSVGDAGERADASDPSITEVVVGASSTAAPETTPTTIGPLPTLAPADLPDYARQGPYVAGRREVVVDGRTVTVWYPALGIGAAVTYRLADLIPPELAPLVDPEAWSFATAAIDGLDLAPDGPFPLVVYSHGSAGFRSEATFLTTHLASWGFIVAAPEHVGRNLAAVIGGGAVPVDDVGDLHEVIEAFTIADPALGPLRRAVDTERVAVVGRGVGGVAGLRLAADPIVDTYVSLGGAARIDELYPEKPSLFVGALADRVVAFGGVESSYQEAPRPKRMGALPTGTQLTFVDLCALAVGDTPLTQPLVDGGIEVPAIVTTTFGKGCEPGTATGPAGWAPVRQLVTGHLRDVWDIDLFPVGFGPELETEFGAVALNYAEDLG